jgi:hypothetical protein
VLAGVYGGYLLLTRQDAAGHVATAAWLATGVVLHDLVLAPLFLVLSALGARVLPSSARAPVVVGLVVLGSVTLLAIPVLGRFGARPDNPTLLDRAYGPGWAVLAALTVLAVVLAAALRARSRRRASTSGRHAAPLA